VLHRFSYVLLFIKTAVPIFLVGFHGGPDQLASATNTAQEQGRMQISLNHDFANLKPFILIRN